MKHAYANEGGMKPHRRAALGKRLHLALCGLGLSVLCTPSHALLTAPPDNVLPMTEAWSSLKPSTQTDSAATQFQVELKAAPLTQWRDDPGRINEFPGPHYVMDAHATWAGTQITGWQADSSITLNGAQSKAFGFGPLEVRLDEGKVFGHPFSDAPEAAVPLLRFDPSRIWMQQQVYQDDPGVGWQRVSVDITLQDVFLSPEVHEFSETWLEMGLIDSRINSFMQFMTTPGRAFSDLHFTASYLLPQGGSISVVPESGTLTMMATGLVALVFAGLARRRTSTA